MSNQDMFIWIIGGLLSLVLVFFIFRFLFKIFFSLFLLGALLGFFYYDYTYNYKENKNTIFIKYIKKYLPKDNTKIDNFFKDIKETGNEILKKIPINKK